MNIYLLSSYSEGTSMTLLEAMASGIPSIVTNVGGNPEIIKDGYNGIVVNNMDDISYANAIKKLLTHHSLREEMCKNARKTFLGNFTASKMASQYNNLYCKLLSHELPST
jgi:glycosyltransferase involved in cell wall biosynthesis